MLKIAFPGVAVADGQRAGAVADLDQVAQLVVGLVRVGLVPVIALLTELTPDS